MASLQETTNVECRRSPRHEDFIPLAEFTPRHLPREYRSQRNWALIRMKAILAVKLVVKEPLACSGSGCITAVDDSKNDKIKLTVKTAAHLGYEKDKPSSTEVNLFVPDTNTVLESNNVELKAVDKVEDIAMLSVTFERHNFTHLSNIHKALTPNRYTLWAYVLEKYQTVKLPPPSFLVGEISCIKHIEFASRNPDVLNIHLQVEHMYMIDVMLFIHAYASHPEDMRILLTKMADGIDIKDEACSPVTVVSPEIFAEHSAILDRLKPSLCNPLSESVMGEINECLRDLFTFAISVRLTESNVMTMLVGSTATLAHWSEEEQTRGGETRNIGAMVPDTQPTDIGLGANIWNEGQSSSSSVFDARNKRETKTDTMPALMGIFDEQTGEKEDLITYVKFKRIKKYELKKPDPEDTLAVLISYPHGQEPQYITIGYVTRYHDVEVFYTTPSCDGSSGGPVWLIQRKPTSSIGELDGIGFATHSSGSDVSGTGVLYEFPNS